MLPRSARALLDLVLPVSCAGCGEDGTPWCARCAALLRAPARRVAPDPVPDGLPPTWAVQPYRGAVRAAVIAHKEHGVRTLGRPLGAALAAAVLQAVPAGRARPLLLVPVPSRPAAVRARGDDPTRRLARVAAAALGAGGRPARVLAALRMARATEDQAGLSGPERAANLAGALRVSGRRASDVRDAELVVVDDVITTGASLAESAAVLRAAGAHVLAAAVVAATVRRGSGLSPASGRG